MPHVGLADLVRTVPSGAFGMLPKPQRRSLNVALLREEASEGDLDPRAVGTGLTTLLGAVAGDGPLLLAVDDAQWLDPASAGALAFALRRLEERPVAMLAAVRAGEGDGGRGGAFAAVGASLRHDGRQRLGRAGSSSQSPRLKAELPKPEGCERMNLKKARCLGCPQSLPNN